MSRLCSQMCDTTPRSLPEAKRLVTIAMAAAFVTLVPLCTGCASQNAAGGGSVSHVPSVDPTTQPLPSNIPPDQQAKIRQQQAAAYAQAKAAQQAVSKH